MRLTEQWNTKVVVPALRALYQDLYDDIAGPDGIVNTATERADLLQLGTEEDFVAGFRTDVFNPLVEPSPESAITRPLRVGSKRHLSRTFRSSVVPQVKQISRHAAITLIAAINSYYDAEEARIENLKLSEDELKDLRQDTQLAREQALRQAENQTNQFAELRIRNEMRVADQIQDLRDDALEAERDRHEQLVELEEKTQERILDIQRKANRSREDIEREFQRDYQDIQRERFDAQNEILQDTSLSGEERARRLAELDQETTQRLQALGRERLEDLQDVDIRQGRDREDIDRQFAEQRIVAEQQSAQTQAELSTRIAALTQELSVLREGEPTDPTAVLESETAPILKEAATHMQQTAPIWQETAEGLKTVAEDFMSADIPGLFEAVESSIDVQTRIAVSMERLPTLLEDSFEKVFKELSDTFLELTQIETGIRKGAVIDLYEQFPELLCLHNSYRLSNRISNPC